MLSITSMLLLLGAGVANAAPRGAPTELARRQDGGDVLLQNQCDQTVYYDVLFGNERQFGGSIPGGKDATASFTTSTDVAISIKASFDDAVPQTGPAIQFEVNRDSQSNSTIYDISAIEGDPFKAFGTSWGITYCDTIDCPANDDSCALQSPTDKGKEHTCSGVSQAIVGLYCNGT